MLHGPRFYKHIHKMHHGMRVCIDESLPLTTLPEFTAPVAFSSTYCTLTEHLFSNILPVFLGILILQAHWSMMIMFFCSLELGTLGTHSGYNLPWNSYALQHDWHHYIYTENYAPIGFMDSLHGSNTVFKAWLAELKRREERGNHDDVLVKAREEIARREANREHPGEMVQTVT
jgi:sterol desaturase/sphingolipid hydroxylase (fatty acid hydroxylase superfamily)